MIIKVCDRCRKQFYPAMECMQAILPSYKITKYEAFLHTREIDLCSDCQNDFAKWMKEKLDNGEDNEQ